MASKSDKFIKWVERLYDERNEVPKVLVKLEEAARICVHDIDAMGEIDPKSLHALIRASKNLRREYEQD